MPLPKKPVKNPAWALNRCADGKLRSGLNRIELTDSEVVLRDGANDTTRVPLLGAVAHVETMRPTTRHPLIVLEVAHPLGPVMRLEVWKREAEEARAIAEVVNAAALALADPGPESPVVPGQVSAVEQLALLADLHARGALTDAEFADAKARIISRL